MNIIEIKPYDVVNGPGIRCSIWLAGCNNNCKGCFSKHTWDPKKGRNFVEIEYTLNHIITNPELDGISILGGDPFYHLFNPSYTDNSLNQLKLLLNMCHNTKKSVWLWTGYKYEDIKKQAIKAKLWETIVKCVDVIVDGKFEEDKKDLNLYYRGSSNQRIIDVKSSENEGYIIEKVVE